MYNKKYCNTECCNSIRRAVEYILLTMCMHTYVDTHNGSGSCDVVQHMAHSWWNISGWSRAEWGSGMGLGLRVEWVITMTQCSQITQTTLRSPLKCSSPLHCTSLDLMEIVPVSRVLQTGLVSPRGWSISSLIRLWQPSFVQSSSSWLCISQPLLKRKMQRTGSRLILAGPGGVDGVLWTLVPFSNHPYWYGESYFDWKCNYSLNIQVFI